MQAGRVTSWSALPLPAAGLDSLSPQPRQSSLDLCVASFTSVAREYNTAFLGLPLQTLEAWPLKPGGPHSEEPHLRADILKQNKGKTILQTRFKLKREIREMV